MNIEEIKINNIISDNGFEITVCLENIDLVLWNIGRFQPIPLNEEWLIKTGCEKVERKFIWFEYVKEVGEKMCYIKLRFNNGKIELYVFNSHIDWIELKFVHQWQNLIYALTGEELTLKS